MDETVRKEIIFRGSRRGIKELDLLLNPFVNNCLDGLVEVELYNLRELLQETEVDLLNWFSLRKYPQKYSKIMQKIAENKEKQC